MSRLTVVHAAKFYPPARGGMERMLGDICSGTSENWDVRVVAASDGGATIHEQLGGVDVVRAGAWTAAHSVPLCPSMPRHLWSRRADCIVLHEPNPLAGSSLFLHTPAPRFVIWHHSDLVRPAWAPHTYGHIQRALYRRADCVIVSSPSLAARSALVGCARRVAVIPFGVALEHYRRDDAVRRSRVAEIRASAPGPHVLFVGRLVYYKGVEIAIRAMAHCPGTLTIVGTGPLEPSLREAAARHGVADRVRFAGSVPEDDLPAYYQACDLFVLPSIAVTEAFGIVQIEAMAAGAPVVSTNLPTGVPWVNQHDVTGLVVPPGDADGLAHAMRALLEDDDRRKRLGAQASCRADRLFSRERMVASFRSLIETTVRTPERLEEYLVEEQLA
jgi:glycosyltransferase involved in cell wall biosynthesis